jgi:hypothetical protein
MTLMDGARSINWLEILAWTGLTLLLLTLIGATISHIWRAVLNRLRALEIWRESHQSAHQSVELEIKLQLRDIQNKSENHTVILEKLGKQFEAMEGLMHELIAMGGNRRRPASWSTIERLKVRPT